MFDPTNVAAWTKELNRLTEAASASLSRGAEETALGELRAHFQRILDAYPTSSLLWYSWMQFEWRHGQYEELERLFSSALKTRGDVRMWRLYLQYVRTGNAMAASDGPDVMLEKRQTINKAYELALSAVGVDLHSLPIYRDYITFIQSWPTGSLYEQQVQMDASRKVYHRAFATPLEGIEALWHEYDAWENSLNKLTAAKVLADRSSVYMAARATARELRELAKAVNSDEYAMSPKEDAERAALKCWRWLRWVEWEKRNPLGLPPKSPLLHSRIQYVYRQMLAVLRHYSELWFDYARWLKAVGRREEAETVLGEAVAIFPRDALLVFAWVDLLEELSGEASSKGEAGDQEQREYREKIRSGYETFIGLLESVEAGAETKSVSASASASAPTPTPEVLAEHKAASNDSSIESSAQSAMLTLAYIQYMNYCRRSEGIAAARAVFTRARKCSQVTFHLFLAAAQMEYHFKKDPVVAGRIYELGMSRFPRSAEYVASYLRHLLLINDEQNARALFERAVSSLPSDEGLLEIWKCYLDHAFCYEDAVSIRELKRRFQEAFPEHTVSKDITMFCRRYSWWSDAGDRGGGELSVGSERIWSLLQLSTSAVVPPPAVERRCPEPFIVPESVMDWISRLPLHYDGPQLDVDLLLSLIANHPRLTSEPAAPTPSAPVRGTLTKRTAGERGRKRRQHRLDDGEGGRETAQMPLRADDLFAARRARL